MKKAAKIFGTIVGSFYAGIALAIVLILPIDIAIWSIQWFMRLIGVGV